MPDLAPILDLAVPYWLVAARLAGLFILAPVLSSVMIPIRIKALFVVALAAAVFPRALAQIAVPAHVDLLSVAPMVVRESLIGLCLGAIAGLPLLALEMAGSVMGQQMGFGLARVYNPIAESDADILGQMLFYIGAGAFLAAGGIESLFVGVLSTMDRLPIGGMSAGQTPLVLFLDVLAGGFELAMRVSAPIAAIVLLLIIALGVVSKTMPQLNVMSVGFTIKIVCGLAVAAWSITAISDAAGDHVGRVMDDLLTWAGGLQAP